MSTLLSRGTRRGGIVLQFLYLTFARSGPVPALGYVLAGLVVAWGLCFAAGGSHTALPHLFYFPIVLAAVRFSWTGACTTAVAAGLVAGPLLPAEVDTGTMQPLRGWLLRLLIFVCIGLLVSWLARDRGERVHSVVHDTVLSSRLLQALARGEVHVAYQPIVQMATRKVVGVEALARWTHPRLGEVSPAEFVPAAERTGSVTALDRFVLREAARQVREWSARGHPLAVSVNVSATRFAERDLVDDVRQVLAATGLPPRQLQLEITESALIEDVAAASRQVAQVRALGVLMAIDDFGAGQASLTYIDRFAVDTVKIDRELVNRAADEPRTARLVAGVTRLLKGIDLYVVAEGVETAEECVHLHSLGCDFVQGFYVGRPMPPAEVEKLLRDREQVGDAPVRSSVTHPRA